MTHTLKTTSLTILALIAFAANSVLCRLALKDGVIDASGFTTVRLVSGITMFLLLMLVYGKPGKQQTQQTNSKKPWLSASMLFLYAITFSFAYISLDTGTGALILFGVVQLTIIAISYFQGDKLSLAEWIGVLVSFSGLTYLVAPTVTTPDAFGFILMVLSGIAWGFYTVMGRGSISAFNDTARNFVLTFPLVILLVLVTWSDINLSVKGMVLASLSGAVASALGYTIWYQALRNLSNIEAAVVQLSVPVIAAVGGVLFVAEVVTLRLIIASVLVLGGIFLVIINKSRSA
ncbi:DMT family transporter [Thalassotalea sp. PS06]|uniref:DMT family transporter n=1 Tax=Thalassotalea sp. PS06 TaxID=2594005 RepID=UPI00163DA64C|nr:DMT family transporter [Thalassotalea sp. PS06]